jgi:5-methylthioadenosine/S-adenosylhomocysteine deaminase
VHNINSNLKLSSGYKFMYNELRDAGANVCMGTDGCASSNNLDILEAMKTSALVQKGWRKDPKVWPLNELIDTATVNGAKALRLDTGVIEEGKLADILVIDPGNSFFLSPGTFLANFVYSAHSDCIDSVIAGGRLVMKNKVIEGEKEILENARKVLSELI